MKKIYFCLLIKKKKKKKKDPHPFTLYCFSPFHKYPLCPGSESGFLIKQQTGL